MTELHIPQWIKKNSECLFCHKWTDASKVEIKEHENQEAVRVEYECKNPSCSYLKFDWGPSIYTFLYTNKYPDAYREFLKANPTSFTVVSGKEY